LAFAGFISIGIHLTQSHTFLKPVLEISGLNWCVCEPKCSAQYIFIPYWFTELVPKYNLQTTGKVCWRCVTDPYNRDTCKFRCSSWWHGLRCLPLLGKRTP